jgi:mannose-6-phosphate isomerase-like protein (cupin superfamily)
MKRQGLGGTVPLEDRKPESFGFSAKVFEGDQFVMRSAVIAAGNNLGLGVNEESDRVFRVQRGTLFAYVVTETIKDPDSGEESYKQDILQVQEGSLFRAPKGLKHSVASSGTADVEVLIIEGPNYDATWQALGEVTQRAAEGMITGVTPANPVPVGSRRVEQQQRTREVALAQATKRNRRRQPRGPVTAANAAGQVAAPVGRNAADNANSANVVGVNPMPEIPTAD